MKVEQAFLNGKAFIPFLTCGYPDLETTEQMIYALARAGADLIQLGIPFSDPTAEGPVLQRASEEALRAGINTDGIFSLVKRVRAQVTTPLAFQTYANIVFSYGTDRFVGRMAELGVSAMILPDVPYEEKDEFDAICRKEGVSLIPLVAPTSGDRMAKIVRDAQGFIYVSPSMDADKMVGVLRHLTSLPIVVDYGPGQFADLTTRADGVIVATIMEGVVEHGSTPDIVYDQARTMVAVMKGAGAQALVL
jgi:tryptophan synthase alpha chain